MAKGVKNIARDYSEMVRSHEGRKARRRIDKLITEAGGIIAYMQGTASRPTTIARKDVKENEYRTYESIRPTR